MEKLVYVVWGEPGELARSLGARFRNELAPRLIGLGAHTLQMNLADEHVGEAQKVRLSHTDPPIAGTVSFWMDCADERGALEGTLVAATSRLAGYLVAESVPLRDVEHPAPDGERRWGTNLVALIEKPERLSFDAWLEHWHGHHREVALETQATYHYVRNVVLRSLTPDAPPWRGIVEEVFADDAVTDPMKWYAAGDDPERLDRNRGAMIESVQAFLDIGRVESHPTSRYVWEA